MWHSWPQMLTQRLIDACTPNSNEYGFSEIHLGRLNPPPQPEDEQVDHDPDSHHGSGRSEEKGVVCAPLRDDGLGEVMTVEPVG